MREKDKREKKYENGWVKGKHTNIYPYVYIHTPTGTQTYIHADAHVHTYMLIIQVR